MLNARSIPVEGDKDDLETKNLAGSPILIHNHGNLCEEQKQFLLKSNLVKQTTYVKDLSPCVDTSELSGDDDHTQSLDFEEEQ